MLDIDENSALLIAVWIEIFAYGIYSVLVCICAHLFRSRRLPNLAVVLSTIILYVLCTVKLILDLMQVLQPFIINPKYSAVTVYQTGAYIYVTTNIIADSLLIYRCYIIWNSNIFVIAIPAVFLLGTAISGYLTFFTGITLMYITLATNILVTSLSAGRIWWISRRLRQFLGSKVYSKYKTILAIMIESGLLYPMSLVIYISIHHLTWVRWTAYCLLSQVVGIAPTLLLVRICLGCDVYEESMRSMEVTKSQSSSGVVIPLDVEDVPADAIRQRHTSARSPT